MAKIEPSIKSALTQYAIAHRGILSYSQLAQYQNRFQLSRSELEAALLEVAAEFATPLFHNFMLVPLLGMINLNKRF
ncbi:hypothetical protein [Pseudoalteromonas piscicida]|uniref:hypothetical protein n=1 Tax=Pseudoalteromonas piscicida TaxID=43662 RepID=UPI001E5C115C|nr:hypothetical protein [Pseudoalteromonas piscicida]